MSIFFCIIPKFDKKTGILENFKKNTENFDKNLSNFDKKNSKNTELKSAKADEKTTKKKNIKIRPRKPRKNKEENKEENKEAIDDGVELLDSENTELKIIKGDEKSGWWSD